MTRPHRVRRLVVSLATLALLTAAPAFPSGFQIMTQGARATGMGLAFTAVANDPSAIFYNPAGLGWQEHFSVEVGSSFISKVKGDFSGANPSPGENATGRQHKTTFVLPTIYAVVPLTQNVNFGLGVFAQYGLGFRWDDAERWAGRFVSQNAVIQSTDVNPVVSWKMIPELSIAVGADYRVSKVQLERNNASLNPFTNSYVDTAHVKLNSDLLDNHAWGWNAGLLVKPLPSLSVGASYRSSMTIDYNGTAKFTQRPTGNAVFDAIVASRLPQGNQKVSTSIAFPATANFGAAFTLPGQFLVSLEADWTEWSKFKDLLIDFASPTIPDLDRQTRWKDSWAYRVGLEKKFGGMALRAGYYRDKTPQPQKDAGPLLADNDRDAYTLGLGYDTDRWGINLADLYLKLKDRSVLTESSDNFFGRYKESVNILAFSLRVSF